jgi:soluble lytic murein transglycosylase-like protein
MTCRETCLSGGIDNLIGEHSIENISRDERMWKVARMYCAAGRLGSTEPLYRLGMLYLAGAGVPSSREAAVSLFRMAQERGHSESAAMLDTLGTVSQGSPPACIAANIDPEKKPVMTASVALADDPVFKGHEWIVKIVESVAQGKGVDPMLVLAVIRAESGFNHKAVSNKNAMGLMQLIPDTAARFNVKDAFDVAQNVKGGVSYLKWLLDRYGGDLHKVLAAYNAGEGNVDRYKGVPPFRETREYVKRVLGYLAPLR